MIPDHNEFENSIAAFLMGTADPEEAEVVRVHLEGCSSCRELAARLQRTLGVLPVAVESVAPPARLRDRVLAAAAAKPQSARAPVRARVTRLPLATSRDWLARAPGFRSALAAAAVVAFALGAGLGLGVGRSLPASAPPAAVARYSLTGTGPMAGVRASVYELKQDGLTLVQFNDMPAPAAGTVYELWLIPKDGGPEPAGVFVPDPDGGRVVLVPRTLGGVKTVAVTVERGPNGSPAPTQQPQLAGSIV